MGVKMNVDKVCNHLFKMNTYIAEIPLKCSTIENQITSFSQDSSLDGIQYNNHKSYMKQFHTPILTGVKNFCSEMMSANNQYRDCLNTHFSDVRNVDEDKWRMEYEQIKIQYEQANSMLNYIMEMVSQLSMMGGKSYMVIIDNYAYIANSYQEQIDMLYEALEMYRERIKHVGQMLVESADIYTGTEDMGTALAAAIHTMTGVQYNTATNCYSYGALDLTSINELNTTWENLQIAKEIRKVLGDDILTAEEFEALSQEEQMEYAQKLYENIAPWIPNITSKLGSGTIEIPIANGLVLYAGVSSSIKIQDTESAESVNLARSKNNEILASWSMKVGNMSGKVERERRSIKNSVELDETTTVYWEFEIDANKRTLKVENGVTTTVMDDGTVTSKAGLEIGKGSDLWEEVKIENYEMGGVSEPREVIDIPPILSPVPAPVPVF